MTIRSEEVKKLREETGVGIMDCKNALVKAEGNLDKAKQILREEGKELLTQKGREAKEGRVEAYLHHSGTVGVLVEVICNTDFAANSMEFRQFTRDLAMQVAATKPRYLSPDDVPAADLEAEKAIYLKQIEKERKPPQIMEKIVEGRLKKFLDENCLVKQPFIKDPTLAIEDLLGNLRTKTGENVQIKRFCRFEVGEGT
jgi:elongation factor Ts